MRSELTLTPGEAARLGHVIQARGGELGKLLERLDDHRKIRIDDRGLACALCFGQTGVEEHPIDGAVMNAQLLGNRIHPPTFHEVIM